MDFINKIFSGGKSKDISYIEEAQNAAKIVDSSVEKGDFSQLTEKLDKMTTIGISRGKYVFDAKTSAIDGWSIFIAIVFTIGYLYFIPICLGTLFYSDAFENKAIIGIVETFVILVLNIIFVVKLVFSTKFVKRYEKYQNVLRFKNIEIIDDLAAYSGQSSERVIQDLEKAVKMKLIPQGHFGRDNVIFIVSNDTYETYKTKQAVYDRHYRKLVEERLRMKERTKEMQAILDQGQLYVNKIHESNDIIKDKIISQKLDRMEKVVAMIFHEVDVNSAQADKLGMFMNYYLPTTEKLLNAYIEIDEKQVRGKTLEKSKRNIESAMDKIIDSFEGLLDKFYQEQEMDLATDISAMEIIMKQDGLTE